MSAETARRWARCVLCLPTPRPQGTNHGDALGQPPVCQPAVLASLLNRSQPPAKAAAAAACPVSVILSLARCSDDRSRRRKPIELCHSSVSSRILCHGSRQRADDLGSGWSSVAERRARRTSLNPSPSRRRSTPPPPGISRTGVDGRPRSPDRRDLRRLRGPTSWRITRRSRLGEPGRAGELRVVHPWGGRVADVPQAR